MIRTVTATRRGPGRDFLVFGRMQRPCLTRNVRKIRWVHGTTKRALDAVFHACWTAPDGRYAIVLANWTTQRQPVTVDDANLGGRAVVHIVSRRSVRAERAVRKHRVRVTLPPLSCAVVEAAPVR
jgi:hypothetical protein